MHNHVPFREVETPPPPAWPKRRIALWALLFIVLGVFAFVGWALTT
jgi:polyferredoxin